MGPVRDIRTGGDCDLATGYCGTTMIVLTLGAESPVGHFGLVDNEAIIVGGRQARGLPNGTVHVGDVTAVATDDVVMIVTDPIFVERR